MLCDAIVRRVGKICVRRNGTAETLQEYLHPTSCARRVLKDRGKAIPANGQPISVRNTAPVRQKRLLEGKRHFCTPADRAPQPIRHRSDVAFVTDDPPVVHSAAGNIVNPLHAFDTPLEHRMRQVVADIDLFESARHRIRATPAPIDHESTQIVVEIHVCQRNLACLLLAPDLKHRIVVLTYVDQSTPRTRIVLRMLPSPLNRWETPFEQATTWEAFLLARKARSCLRSILHGLPSPGILWCDLPPALSRSRFAIRRSSTELLREVRLPAAPQVAQNCAARLRPRAWT